MKFVSNSIRKLHRLNFVETCIFFFWFFYCCSIKVVPISHYSPLPYPPHTSHIQPSPFLLSVSMGPLYMFFDLTLPLFSPVTPLPSPLLLLSVCSLFPCLWFYFAHLLVLLIRFHLQVRSYGICPSPPGLFHLA